MSLTNKTLQDGVKGSIRDQATPGETAIAVVGPDGAPISGVAGVSFTLDHDAVTVTYPTSTQEIYSARTGGVSGTVVQTITVNYVNAFKKDLLNAFRT